MGGGGGGGKKYLNMPLSNDVNRKAMSDDDGVVFNPDIYTVFVHSICSKEFQPFFNVQCKEAVKGLM